MVMAILEWMFPMVLWLLEKVPDPAFSTESYAALTAQLESMAVLLPLEGLTYSLTLGAVVYGLNTMVTMIRIIAKILSVARGGAW